MEPAEARLSVWICQEEKLVSGLSKRTTCSDVVRALLEDSQRQGRRGRRGGPPPPAPPEGGAGGPVLGGPPQCYRLVEKWRGFERALPDQTRLLRLWAAWGDERPNVRFVLVRSEASLPNAGPRSAQARVVPSRERPGPHGRGAAGGALSQERQRRLVRKAFRKLAKLNRRKAAQPPAPPARPAPQPAPPSPPSGPSWSWPERMETLVHLVLSQDHTLRQQRQRLAELDRQIERYEAGIHWARVRRHGANYVQETYLEGGEAAAEEEAGGEGAALAALEAERARQEALGERLAAQIQEELNARWMRRRREELAAARGSEAGLAEADGDTTELAGEGGGAEAELPLEQARLRTQLSASLYIGLRLSTDLQAVGGRLEESQRAWAEKERELRGLLDTLRALEDDEEDDDDEEEEGPPEPPPTVPPEPWGDQPARPPGKEEGEENGGEDSDTGLSSMHSQDSDSVPVCESLV